MAKVTTQVFPAEFEGRTKELRASLDIIGCRNSKEHLTELINHVMGELGGGKHYVKHHAHFRGDGGVNVSIVYSTIHLFLSHDYSEFSRKFKAAAAQLQAAIGT